jgi:hypothetical protein
MARNLTCRVGKRPAGKVVYLVAFHSDAAEDVIPIRPPGYLSNTLWVGVWCVRASSLHQAIRSRTM